jgi:hypothetical protein
MATAAAVTAAAAAVLWLLLSYCLLLYCTLYYGVATNQTVDITAAAASATGS